MGQLNQKEQKSNAIYLMKIWATIFVVFIHSANIFN
jgi:hypothetical protein